MEKESNQSTTITITRPDGGSFVWNSGTYITCFLLGNGVGFTAWAYSLGKKIAYDVATKLTTFGCVYVVKQMNADEGDGGGAGGGGDGNSDGSEGGSGSGGDVKLPSFDPPKTPGGYWQNPASVELDPLEIMLIGTPDVLV